MPISMNDIQPQVRIVGLSDDDTPATVVQVNRYADDIVEVYYTSASYKTDMVLITERDLEKLELAPDSNQSPSFDGDAAFFRLASEALRIKYAALYDPMAAVHSSAVQPLPHQIRAVYEELLPRIPLRFLLADDPGAGKTIMAGLYIKELILRASCDRAIIVCPGGLADQWQEELDEKFDLQFEVFGTHMVQEGTKNNPFEDHPYLIVRMDQLARNEVLLDYLGEVTWDVAIVDEAHRMSANYQGAEGKIHKTKRYMLGEKLGETAHHLLLMTATPHAGKEDNFQLFLALLDSDRFAGRYDEKRHEEIRTDGIMRRMIKEDLLTFEGKPLFPKRVASTVKYTLSPQEQALYDDVTEYVRTEMNRAKRLEEHEGGARPNRVGFALTVLQRRLASSPEAIHQSLKRRHARLSKRLQQIQDYERDKATYGTEYAVRRHCGEKAAALLASWQDGAAEADIFGDLVSTSGQDLDVSDVLFSSLDSSDDAAESELRDVTKRGFDNIDYETLTPKEIEDLEQAINDLADIATAASSIEDLEAEIASLRHLTEQARKLCAAGTDRKWQELSKILSDEVLSGSSMDESGEEVRKIIVFTEHRDTLDYLQRRISNQLGNPDAVVSIHGGTTRPERLAIKENFTNDPTIRVLIATDAAGEGLNLQRAHLMVNYDLPWNPNRIEQRFGRIHRIGQKRVCYLWNMVADGTREGYVFERLLDKIQTQEHAYEGKLFHVLGRGDAFNNASLADLIKRAILEGDSANSDIERIVDATVGDVARQLADASAFEPLRSQMDLDEIREFMDKALERKLQPGFIEAFFLQAFAELQGICRPVRHEPGRYQIYRVSKELLEAGHSHARTSPISRRYERVTFDPACITHPGAPDATLIAPGHPLLEKVIEQILDRHQHELDRGTILIDNRPSASPEPSVILSFDNTVRNKEREPATVARFSSYVEYSTDGAIEVHDAPVYLSFDPPTAEEKQALKKLSITSQAWLTPFSELEQAALTANLRQVLIPRREELIKRQSAWAERLKQQVTDRLQAEASHYFRKSVKTRHDSRQQEPSAQEAKRYRERGKELEDRIKERCALIDAQANLVAIPPVRRSRALIVPRALLEPYLPQAAESEEEQAALHALDTTEVERRAVDAVLRIEEQIFHRVPEEMPHNNKGFDIISRTPERTLFLEVKGRIAGSKEFHITSHEVQFARSQQGNHYLALVEVSPDGPAHDRVRYVDSAFADVELAATTHSLVESWQQHWNKGFDPEGRATAKSRPRRAWELGEQDLELHAIEPHGTLFDS